MNNKKILAVALIFILLMLLFRSSRNYVTTTKVVYTHPYHHPNARGPNARGPNPNYHPNANPFKAQFYN